jgi:glycosyltransferase involved in cell wall biosynthesis
MIDASVSVVHEWLTEWGGSEDVVRSMLESLPQAPLHATIDFLTPQMRVRLGERQIKTTFLQKAPGVRQRFWYYLPLTPLAVESHDLRGAQVVVSSSHAFAKGVLTSAEQLHVSYVHSPMRWAWDLHHEYLADHGLDRGAKGLVARHIFHRLRQWDRQTANNVDLFLANSRFVQRRIWRAYRRPSVVLHPPVATERFVLQRHKEDFYVTVSRLVSYKRIDLMLDAFRQMPSRRLVVIGDGPEAVALRRRCPPNVTLLGWQPDEIVQQHLGAARAFVFAAVEDFGISPVEAQACGTPVIALGMGGATETVRGLGLKERPTGIFYPSQTPESLVGAIEKFEAEADAIRAEDCWSWAQSFDEAQFRARFLRILERAWEAWRLDPLALESSIENISSH